MSQSIDHILSENLRRLALIDAPFNPYTGEGSVGERFRFEIPDFPIPVQFLPVAMRSEPLLLRLDKAGSLRQFLLSEFPDFMASAPQQAVDDARVKVIDSFVRLRCRYDFPFWAATFVYIKNKDGGEDCLFSLTLPQRRFVERLEQLRLASKPIRLVLLKARQWGGSTTSQLYMAWLQLIHRTGLNSLIIAHQGAGSDEIKDMFDRMIKAYPLDMLHELADQYQPTERKIEGVGRSGSISRVPQRNAKIKIGTAERPDSCRGGDYALVHLSEVGLWKATDGKKPEDIVRSACSGVLFKPYTMIVYESTANGTGNFFQREYDAAKQGSSQFEAMFISWFDIPKYSLPFASDADRRAFAEGLLAHSADKAAFSDREQPGAYLWWLWSLGASLEAINWYVQERRKYNEHALMASEYPSDDVEAFVHSGQRVFDRYRIEALRPACRPPRFIGEVFSDSDSGREALSPLRFAEDPQGELWVWALPEIDPDELVTHRYLTVVDIGGRSNKADWSVVAVFDRLNMVDGGKPTVVAQWRGHSDIDILAWRAAQIAAFYDNSLLVIESNTLETHDRDRMVDGDQSSYVLNQIADVYPNLYARQQSEEDVVQGLPRKYGFHTNVSTKPMVISALVRAIREGSYVERDVRALDEFLVYERRQNGSFGAIAGKHDDILMTRAIGLHICFSEMPPPAIIPRASLRASPRHAISAASF